MLTKRLKTWYNLPILLFCLVASAAAQDSVGLSREEQLRLENLQLKKQLLEARQEYVNTLNSYSRCVSDSFTRQTPLVDAQIAGAYDEWRTDIEKNHPGKTWDGTKLIPKVDEKK